MSNPRPIFGLTQEPDSGLLLSYRNFVVATGKSHEIEEAIDVILDIVAVNVRSLMEERIEASNKPLALAKKAHLGKGTIQRVLGGSKGHGGQARSAAAIDTLMYIADALDVPFGALFVPRDRKSRLLSGLDAGPSKPPSF